MVTGGTLLEQAFYFSGVTLFRFVGNLFSNRPGFDR